MMKEEYIKEAYGSFYHMVKGKTDDEGWVYCRDLPYMEDCSYEARTGNRIEFEKGSENHTGKSRWRPMELKYVQRYGGSLKEINARRETGQS